MCACYETLGQAWAALGRNNIPDEWTTDPVLDVCPNFFVNNWASLYAYQSIW